MHRLIALALSFTLVLQVTPLMAAAKQAPAATTGSIDGTAQSATGQTLPNYTVRVRSIQTGQLTGTTTSSATGTFSFAGLNPGTYVVEIVNSAGEIVGTSAPTLVTAGATVAVTVSAAAAAAIATGAGVSTALVVSAIAAAAGIAGVIVVVRGDASPSQ